MKRVILLIIDSMGVGAMDDVINDRPQDVGTNTLRSLIKVNPNIKIPTLNHMGLNRLVEGLPKTEVNGSYGMCNLAHQGADSYLGHQEIMGTKPQPATIIPFKNVMQDIKLELEKKGYVVEIPDKLKAYLLVNNNVIVADNIETDYGQIYNVTGAFDEVSFDEVLEVAYSVRKIVKVNRVIALGGTKISTKWLMSCVQKREDGLVGVNCPKSKVYDNGYKVRHIGLGVDPTEQVTSKLIEAQKEVVLIGKMQDVITCDGAEYIPAVDTNEVMNQIGNAFDNLEEGLIAATVQETDLAGHAEDAIKYGKIVEIVDIHLTKIIEKMTDEDLLIVSADHGNDPLSGHSQHTREKTPLLIYSPSIDVQDVGLRETLSDIAASIADYFEIAPLKNGESFLKKKK